MARPVATLSIAAQEKHEKEAEKSIRRRLISFSL